MPKYNWRYDIVRARDPLFTSVRRVTIEEHYGCSSEPYESATEYCYYYHRASRKLVRTRPDNFDFTALLEAWK